MTTYDMIGYATQLAFAILVFLFVWLKDGGTPQQPNGGH